MPPARALDKLTVERINAEPGLAGALPADVAFTPDGRRVTWLQRSGEASAPSDLWSLDLASGKTARLLEGRAVKVQAPAGSAAEAGALPLGGYVWNPDGTSLLVKAQGDLFRVDARTGTARAIVRTPEDEEFPELSPDGKRVAFVRRHDLYVAEVDTGRETRLTRSGSDTVLNGRLDWVYEEELAARSGRSFAWAPDSEKIAYLQLDQARVPTFPIVDFLPVHNTVATQRYPKAGDPNAIVRVGVVAVGQDASGGPERLVSFTPDDLYVLPELAWSPDSQAVFFQQLNREQNELLLRSLRVPEDPAGALGPPQTVLTEKSPTWLNALPAPRFLKDGRFLWISERTGFAHVFLCERSGACRAVTQGPWMVDAQSTFAGQGIPLKLDERTGFVYFAATEKHARERHLYRVRLDGTGRQRLTVEDGVHQTVLSPDARFFLDTSSSTQRAPRVSVAGVDGQRRHNVGESAPPPLLAFERGSLEWVDVTANDGTVLHGSLLKPADFDAAKRYPVVVSVYGGPGAQGVVDSWSHVSPFEHLLASRGFLVFTLDNRGGRGRGRAFESPLFRSLGKTELEDQLRGVEYLKSLPYVDPARLGLWGWSYGGYLTLYALTRAPDVFRAGVAGAPVTDWKFYDSIYTERYMGQPRANAAGYEGSSPLAQAAALRAELLILHGTADDNVHLANSIAFAEALVKAGRPYVLNVHPGQMHGYAARESRIARDRAVLRHFEQHLKP